MTNPASTAPSVNTDYVRTVIRELLGSGQEPANIEDLLLETCDAVDILRRQFEAQQVYINAMERRWNAAPHGDDCNKTKNTPCDCWKAS